MSQFIDKKQLEVVKSSSKPNRRGFLHTAGLVAAGSLAALPIIESVSTPSAALAASIYDGIMYDQGGAVYNVKSAAFGAKGDGVTDDYPAFVNALTAATSGTLVGTVFVPAGTYRISKPLIVTKSVRIVGAGKEATTLTVLPSDWTTAANGWNTYAVIQAGPDHSTVRPVYLADFKIDCQHRNSPSDPSGVYNNYCVGITPDSSWRIERVHVYDPQSFGFYVANTNNVALIDCESSLGNKNDTIGGGGSSPTLANTNFFIIRHHWNANLSPNASQFDNTYGSVVMDSCFSEASNYMYFEAMKHVVVCNCRFANGSAVIIKSDDNYPSVTQFTSPYDVTISGNYFDGTGLSAATGARACVVAEFQSYQGKNQSVTGKGGFITIEDNTFYQPNQFAILYGAETPSLSYGGGVIRNNKIIDPNRSGSGRVSTGIGTVDVSGINVAGSYKTKVSDNLVLETDTKKMQFAIQIGGDAYTPPNGVIVADNQVSTGLQTGTVVAGVGGIGTTNTGESVPNPVNTVYRNNDAI
jgi:hypothetical protein